MEIFCCLPVFDDHDLAADDATQGTSGLYYGSGEGMKRQNKSEKRKGELVPLSRLQHNPRQSLFFPGQKEIPGALTRPDVPSGVETLS